MFFRVYHFSGENPTMYTMITGLSHSKKLSNDREGEKRLHLASRG
jgi:hypothetical protein